MSKSYHYQVPCFDAWLSLSTVYRLWCFLFHGIIGKKPLLATCKGIEIHLNYFPIPRANIKSILLFNLLVFRLNSRIIGMATIMNKRTISDNTNHFNPEYKRWAKKEKAIWKEMAKSVILFDIKRIFFQEVIID